MFYLRGYYWLQELEAIEDSWRTETKELVTTVEKLQKDNKKLTQQLSNSQAAWEKTSKENEKDAGDELLGKMSEIIDKQREEIRNLQKEVKQKNIYVETVS